MLKEIAQIKDVIIKIAHTFANLVCICVSSLIKKKENKWVFGSWFGNSVSDNPFYLSKYITDHKDFDDYKDLEIVWIVNEIPKSKNPFIKYVKKNSLLSVFEILRSRVAVFNQSYLDLFDYNILGGTYKVQLWHGVPWKKIGFDIVEPTRNILKKINRKLNFYSIECDLYIASSEENKKRIKSAFNTVESKILSVGQPRNEPFFDDSFITNSRNNVLKKMNLDYDSTIIAYLPTFRDKKKNTFSFLNDDFIEEKSKLNELLSKNKAFILEKSHYVNIKNNTQNSQFVCGSFKHVSNIDSQELLAASDILITDYSSCLFDFLLLDRPIIQFLYDYDYYKNRDRGLYYNKEDVSCGQIAFSLPELQQQIERSIKNKHVGKEERINVKNKFCNNESINNCKIIINRIFEDVNLRNKTK